MSKFDTHISLVGEVVEGLKTKYPNSLIEIEKKIMLDKGDSKHRLVYCPDILIDRKQAIEVEILSFLNKKRSRGTVVLTPEEAITFDKQHGFDTFYHFFVILPKYLKDNSNVEIIWSEIRTKKQEVVEIKV